MAQKKIFDSSKLALKIIGNHGKFNCASPHKNFLVLKKSSNCSSPEENEFLSKGGRHKKIDMVIFNLKIIFDVYFKNK